ncbi:hypothetical protein CKO15_01360 [Halorhodospira abdelmalekii]|uniref:OmpA family protein n=1 Tax=Halorhodospira abdelmalekii TaxID=421629 RepID=UPI001904A975|nr:OmpA family protein [Halorhodospira abdelmalekii]MBK1733949.1 hypothetical protein [Halorhodospira abdelmalekii]
MERQQRVSAKPVSVPRCRVRKHRRSVAAILAGGVSLALLPLALLALPVAALAGHPDLERLVHRATPHEARWHAFEGRSGCHMVHEVRGAGTAIVTYRHDNARRFLSFFAHQPPRQLREGDLYIGEPIWRGDRRHHVERLRVHPEPRTLRFSSRTTDQLLDALRSGLEPRFRYAGGFGNQQIEIALTPASFQHAHHHFIDCIDRHERVDAGTATRGLVIPGRTGEALADSAADATWEGDLPRLPRGPRTEVFFATASADLTHDAINSIRGFVRDLEDNPHWGVVLSIGYADTRGAPEANEALARQRASRVRDELIRMGIPQGRIEVEARLLDPENREEDTLELAKNRRVELRTAL